FLQFSPKSQIRFHYRSFKRITPIGQASAACLFASYSFSSISATTNSSPFCSPPTRSALPSWSFMRQRSEARSVHVPQPIQSFRFWHKVILFVPILKYTEKISDLSTNKPCHLPAAVRSLEK